jgi:hypothetical protein
MDADLILSTTDRGKQCLIFDGYTFRLDRVMKDSNISWRCTNNKTNCKARIGTDADVKVVLNSVNEHNHDACERKIKAKQLRTAAKRKVSGDISARSSKIIRKELQEFNECHLHSKDLKNIALAVYHERRKELPALPKTRAEVHEALSNISVLTYKEEHFLPVNDQDKGIVICTCYVNIACLCNDITDLVIDGTFMYCTKFFHQLYTVHGGKNGH